MDHLLGTTLLLGAVRHHPLRALGGRHIVGLVILVIIVVVIVVSIVRVSRRKGQRHLETAAPTPHHSEGAVPAPIEVAAPIEQHTPMTAVAASSAPARAALHEPLVIERHVLPLSGRYGLSGLLRSEWTKLRSVRSTMWTLGITVVLGIGVSALATAETRAHWSTTPLSQRIGFDPISTSLIGVFIGQFAIGILGALVMSAEYGTGTIRATLAAAPRRVFVLVAKVIVFGIVALIVAEVVAFLAFFLGQALLSAPAVHATIGSPGALRAVAGSGLYVGVLGLFSLGLATIIRHTAGAISAFVGILLVLPLVVAALPNDLQPAIRRFLPDRIGASIISHTTLQDAFSPWIGLLVLVGYATAALVIGGVLLLRRDA